MYIWHVLVNSTFQVSSVVLYTESVLNKNVLNTNKWIFKKEYQ